MENVKNDPICHVTRQNQYNPAGGRATKIVLYIKYKINNFLASPLKTSPDISCSMRAFAYPGPRPICQASVTCVKPWGCDWTTWVPEKWLKNIFCGNTCFRLVVVPINHRLFYIYCRTHFFLHLWACA